MGREIKRVPESFDWPVGYIWKGYLSPYRPQQCNACDGSGYNPETKKIADQWYDHDNFPNSPNAWYTKLTQDEVDALVEEGRIQDFTHTFVSGEGWKENSPKTHPTAEQVNEWASGRGFGHDAINRWICVETRAKRLGVWGNCHLCDGKGHYWCDDKFEQLSEDWECIEPPIGEAYQMWETVSEGSPVSPPFAKPEDLAEWLSQQTERWFKRANHTKEEWLKWIMGPGWSPTMVVENGKVSDGIVA